MNSKLVRLESPHMNEGAISLRPATAEDEEFLLEVYKSSRGDDLRGLGWDENRIGEFLGMQYETQKRFIANEHAKASDQIILRDRERVGRLLVERRDQEIFCIDLALLSERRNSGIGAHLIVQMQDEAKRANKPIRLQVIRFSRAVSLFERLGFVRTSETGTHFQMEWLPDR